MAEDMSAGTSPAADTSQPVNISSQVADGVRKGIEDSQRTEREKRDRDEQELRDEQRKIFRKHQREKDTNRDESGKFASKLTEKVEGDAPEKVETPSTDKKPPEAKAKELEKPQEKAAQEKKPTEAKDAADKAKAEQEPEAPKKPAHEAPKHWAKPLRDKLAGLDPELQKEIAEAGTKDQQEKSELGRKLKAFEPIGKLIAEHAQSFQRNNVTPEQGLKTLLAASDALESNPVGSIQHLMRQYGVSLDDLYRGQNSFQQQDPAVQQMAGRVQQLERYFADTQARETERLRAEAADRYQQNTAVVQEFSEKPHFQELEEDIASQVRVLQHSNPHMPVREVLQKAYDAALWTNPTTRAAMEEKIRSDAAAKVAEEARKAAETANAAAKLNVKGSPHAVASDDLRQKQLAVIRKHKAS